ncbi:phospholipid carrier-dependent glycosyltransferase [Streptomyces sp. NPDC006184]|uniref:ArnT family glycosyltransferase n=1 Tax=Streptomyces sp. NPDC006184 TaxID=3155455 RepID=UPI0033B711D7
MTREQHLVLAPGAPAAEPARRARAARYARLRRHGRRLTPLLVVLLLAQMAAAMVTTAVQQTPTIDEPVYVATAADYLHAHRVRYNPEHPPLGKLLIAAGVAVADPHYDPAFTGDQGEAGRRLLYASGNDPWRVMLWARLPVIALTLLCGLVAFAFAREVAGPAGGLVALALYAFSPDLIAHGSLATLDVPAAGFVLVSAWLVWRARRRPVPYLPAAGAALGAAVATKMSALPAVPVLMALAAASAVSAHRSTRATGPGPATRPATPAAASGPDPHPSTPAPESTSDPHRSTPAPESTSDPHRSTPAAGAGPDPHPATPATGPDPATHRTTRAAASAPDPHPSTPAPEPTSNPHRSTPAAGPGPDPHPCTPATGPDPATHPATPATGPDPVTHRTTRAAASGPGPHPSTPAAASAPVTHRFFPAFRPHRWTRSDRWARSDRSTRPWFGGRRTVGAGLVGAVVVVLVALAVVWAAYLAVDPRLRFTPAGPVPAVHGLRGRLVDLLPVPEAYRAGMRVQFGLEDYPWQGYLFGHVYTGSLWYYLPAALLVKTPLGLAALGAAGMVAVVAVRRLRPVAPYLLLPPLVLLAVAMTGARDFGTRYALFVPMFLAVAAGCLPALHRHRDRGRRWAGPLICALVLFAAASSLRAFPYYLPYANEAFGGPAHTHRLLHDSNVDWGQDLGRLADRLRQRYPGERVWLVYKGSGVPSYYGIHAADPRRVPPERVHGLLVVSDSAAAKARGRLAELIAGSRPAGEVGRSISLFRR